MSDDDELDKISKVGGSILQSEWDWWMEMMITKFCSSSTIHPHPMLPKWKQYLPYFTKIYPSSGRCYNV